MISVILPSPVTMPDRIGTTEGKPICQHFANWKSGSIRFDAEAIAPADHSATWEASRVLRGCTPPTGSAPKKMPDPYDCPTDMTEDPDTDHEAGQRRLLRRNRGLATGLLVLAAALFTALRFVPEPGFWVELA